MRFARVKSPAEVVVGTLHLVGDLKFPRTRVMETALECRYMNQDLLNPPSVEGWHTGKEWIDSGSMVERINFVADELGNPKHVGVRNMIDALAGRESDLDANGLVDGCLELLGHVVLRDDNRNALVAQAAEMLENGAGQESVILNALRMIGFHSGVPVRVERGLCMTNSVFTSQQVLDAILQGMRGDRRRYELESTEAIQKNATYGSNLAHYRNVAQKSLGEGDHLQAAEKTWGAYAQTIKGISAAHGVGVSTHSNLVSVAQQLNSLAATTDVPAGVSIASSFSSGQQPAPALL